MSEITGVAKRYDGVAADYVLLFDWETGGSLKVITPDSTGAWTHEYFSDINCGITYISDGCEPITHGPYEFVSLDVDLMVNGGFDDNLLGWTNSNNHWKWVDGSAHHPLSSSYNTLSQIIGDAGLVSFIVDLEIVQGALDLSVYSNRYLYQNNSLPVGRHTLRFTVQTEANAILYFGRKPTIATEMYIYSVRAIKVD